MRALLDAVATRVEAMLGEEGVRVHASPLYRPFNLMTVVDDRNVHAVFRAAAGGLPELKWIDGTGQAASAEAVVEEIRAQFGWTTTAVISLERSRVWESSDEERRQAVEAAARQHVSQVLRDLRFVEIPEIKDFPHLEDGLREFLRDHPEPSRNVFVMMRFQESEQMEEILHAIRAELSAQEFHAIRAARTRDYTGELWTNVETCMLGCKLGIAVFEDIEERSFNPNVALELGWMLARRRRCLMLKEKRLPALPTDMIGRLYKPFDAFNIRSSVQQRVKEWLTVDLRVT